MNRREFLGTLAAVSLEAQERPLLSPPERGFISYQPASRWEEALLSGNGKMGALVMSQALDERVILSHERLFFPIHLPVPPIDMASHLGEIRAMLKEGQYQKASDFVVELSKKEGWKGKNWTDPFCPACDLAMRVEPDGEVRDYARSLDFRTGVASVAWRDNRGAFLRRVFVSRADNVVALSFELPRGLDCELKLIQHPFDERDFRDWSPGRENPKAIRDFEATAEPGWLVYRSRFSLTEGGYVCVARVVREPSKALVLLRVVPLRRFADLDLDVIKRELSALNPSFDALLARHAAEHGKIFDRVALDLGGGAERGEAAEKLVERTHNGEMPPAFLEKIFDAGRYAILSSCGDLPPNLQGVWTGTWAPGWSADYTQNGNVPAAISSVLSANMHECMHSYFSYMESLLPDCRTNARRMFGCEGINVASRTSSHGLNNHFDRTWPMTFWTTGAAWAAQFYYDYWLYTGDREFLRTRALPYMKEAALFFEQFLIEDENGKYLFSPSYSPENDPKNTKSQACVNATQEIAAVKELLGNCIAGCQELGIEREKVAKWRAMLAKMPEYMINGDGAVKEWTHPALDDNYAHRHCSHLYGIFNGLPADIAANPRLVKAFRRAVELRAAERKKEKGGGVMAFGLVQLGLSASSLGDAETVGFVLDRLTKNYYFRNLATSHDPGYIFNTDLSGGLPAVIIKSLLWSRPGLIELLPAVPASLPAGRITGLACRGQVTVHELVWAPGTVRVTLESPRAQKVTLKGPGGRAREVALAAGRRTTIDLKV